MGKENEGTRTVRVRRTRRGGKGFSGKSEQKEKRNPRQELVWGSRGGPKNGLGIRKNGNRREWGGGVVLGGRRKGA